MAISVGYESREKLIGGATATILARAGMSLDGSGGAAAQDWGHDLRGCNLLKLADLVTEREARTNPRLAARLQEAGHRESAIAMAAMGSSSSDFPALLRDSMNQILLKGYQAAPQTWRLFCNRGSFSNFNPYYAFRVGEGENLQLVREGGEYQDSKLLDGEEVLQGFKYGRIFSVTWEAIINDVWDQIILQPKRYGLAAARLVEDLVYTCFMANPTMGDGAALFRATPTAQKNLETGAGSALAAAALDLMLQNMAAQTGLQANQILNMTPRFLLVPPVLMTTARILMNSTGSTAATYNAGVINPYQGIAEPISNPRLSNASFTGYSTTAWYGVADPAQHDTLEVDFLEGQDTPELMEEAGFEVDGRKWKARMCVAVKAVEFRSWHKCAGA